jgi:hypothetical protein
MRDVNLLFFGVVLPQRKDAPSLAGAAGTGATIPPPDERRAYT